MPAATEAASLPVQSSRLAPFTGAAIYAPTIAVIGGGFSGTATALHFFKRHGPIARLMIFEPRAVLGRGLAYSTPEKAHRINVPAARMSLYPDEPENFQRFLEKRQLDDEKLVGPDGHLYPRRAVFGAYVASEIEAYLDGKSLVHIASAARRIERAGQGWLVTDDAGAQHAADIVVLAATHPSPALPRALSHLRQHPKLISDVTRANALVDIAPDDRVLVVGNGLTSADVVATLVERGHKGQITAISRRGLRSRGHPSAVQDPFGDFTSEPATSASLLLRRIRKAIRDAQAQGLSWHAVIDAVRAQAFAIWQALDVFERRRLVRRVRPFWDAHRFRVAPQVEEVIDTALKSGRMRIMAASINGVDEREAGFVVRLSTREDAKHEVLDVDAIVVTTGPAHGEVLSSQAFLKALEDEGYLTACPTGLGIACDLRAHAIDRHGKAVDDLFIVGPLARGTFGELMGLPQVTEHAIFVADRIAEQIASLPRPADNPLDGRRQAG